jgi:phosphoglycerol transferase MdoB-like AlkP superfamily enzyme
MNISENMFLGGGLLSLVLHTLIYLLALRSTLRTEASIFLYHLLLAFALLVFSVVFVVTSMTEERIASAITLISLNGIYSLTFLELWTLSQISYSRELLIKAKANKFLSTSSHVDELARLGDRKRSERLQSLCDLGLLLPTDDGWKLSTRGKLIAGLLQLLNWLPNLKSRG